MSHKDGPNAVRNQEEQGPWERAKDPITNFPDIDSFLRETFEVMRRKGHDYRQGNDADVLHNFRTVSKMVGEPMEKVWFTYFYKHLSALITFVKEGGQSESEPIEGRITDLIVYLVLFWKMVQESKDIAPLRPPSASTDMMMQSRPPL